MKIELETEAAKKVQSSAEKGSKRSGKESRSRCSHQLEDDRKRRAERGRGADSPNDERVSARSQQPEGEEEAPEVSEMRALGQRGGSSRLAADVSGGASDRRLLLHRTQVRSKVGEFISKMSAALVCLLLATCYLAAAEGDSRRRPSGGELTGLGTGDRDSKARPASDGDARSAPVGEAALVRPPSAIKNVSAQNGQSVLLHCLVEPSADAGVSWFRGAGEPQLLTYESTTIIPDERFVVRHNLMKDNDWALQIKNLDKSTDSGLYQCQTNSDPPQSQYYQLNVLEPQVNILGAPDLAVKLNAAINLTCVISQAPDQLQYVFWYRDQRMINFDISERGKIVMSKWPQRQDTMISNLQIFNSRLSDSGNYTCMPANARPMSIQVHVLEGLNKRLIMFQNDYDPSAASSQQTSSAFSVHVVRLSRGRAYALFVALLIFSTWFKLMLQAQTAITILLLAIIGYLLGRLNERGPPTPAEQRLVLARIKASEESYYKASGLLKSLESFRDVDAEAKADPLKRLPKSPKRQVSAGTRAANPALTSPSGHSTGSTSTASTGYNSDTRSTNLTARTSPSVQVTAGGAATCAQVAAQVEAASPEPNDCQQEEEEMIELVSQPTALRLIMEEFSPSRPLDPAAGQESYYSSPTSQVIPTLSEATPTESRAGSPRSYQGR